MGSHHQRLLSALDPLLSEFGTGADWAINPKPLQSRKCLIHKLTGPSEAPSLAIKEYRSEVVKSSAAFTQFNGLMFASGFPRHEERQEPIFVDPALPTKGVPAVRPYAFLPQYNAVVMKWVSAQSLSDVAASGNEAETSHAISTTARWLRAFHDLSPTQMDQIETDLIIQRLNKRFEVTSKPHKHALIMEAINHVHKLAAKQLSAPHAYLHGDFTPTNILIATEGPVGIDIWARRRAPVYEDIARILVYLVSKGTGIWERKPLIRDTEHLFGAFTIAYGAADLTIDNEAFRFILLYQLLRRWLVMSDWARHKHPPFPARAKRKRLEAMLERLIQ